jgi:PAS domain S-box-containing protein
MVNRLTTRHVVIAKIVTGILMAGWALAIAISSAYNISFNKEMTSRLARLEAKSTLDKENAFRSFEKSKMRSDFVVHGIFLFIGLTTLFMGSFLFLRAIKKRDQFAKALRESEERYKIVSSITSDYIYIVNIDNDGKPVISYISDKFTDVTGRNVDDINASNVWMSIIHPDDLDRLMKFFNEHLSSDQPGEMECRTIVKSGKDRWIQIFVKPKVDETTRRPYMLVGAVKDITERKLAEEALKASLNEKEVMLKEIHHRVKNNLQIISSLLSLQIESIKDDSLLSEFHDYRNRVNTMAIIHEKLYQSENYSHVDFSDYINSLVDELTGNFTMTGIPVAHELNLEKVTLTINQAIPCGLIINEVITNSIKYAFPPAWKGSPKITIRLRQDTTNTITLQISDNGVGFKEGRNFNDANSLGFSLIDLLTKQINGTIQCEGNNGVSYKITFVKQ